MASQQQIVLVTGVTRGIGAALLAQLLARKDTRVIAGVRSLKSAASEKLIAQSESDSNLIVVQLDSESDTDASEAARTVQEKHNIDHLDLIIANAGIAGGGDALIDVKANQFRNILNVNVVSPLLLFQAFQPLLSKGYNPRILFVSSSVGSISRQRQIPFRTTTYGCSKVALNFVAVRVATEYPNITSVTICPGQVKTDMATAVTKAHGIDIDAVVQSGGAWLPVDSAKAILKLADEAVNETHSGKFFDTFTGTELPW
jgi:norsolorinic acid ketoreductase